MTCLRFHLRAIRPAAWLALAGLLSVGSTGCSLMRPDQGQAAKAGLPPYPRSHAAPGAGELSSAPRTEFHRQVSAEQQYNVHMELARVHESQGAHEAAVAEYQKAVEVCEKKGTARTGAPLGAERQAHARRRMAAAFDRLGRFAQAEVHYQKALKLAPGDPKVWNDAGYSFYLQNRWADAERCLKTADSLGPHDPRVQTNLGLALAAQGKDKEALAALTRAGGPAVGHANLGYILAAMGKTQEARRRYETALALQPGLSAARQAMARLDAPNAAAPSAVAATPKPDLDAQIKTASSTTSIPPPARRR